MASPRRRKPPRRPGLLGGPPVPGRVGGECHGGGGAVGGQAEFGPVTGGARGELGEESTELRPHTSDGLFAYADAEDVELRIDGTEARVRRPRADRPGENARGTALLLYVGR